MPMPAAVVTPISTIAGRERSAGRSSRATAVASGTRPSPAPCSARPFLARADRVLDELDQGQHELRDAAGLAQGTVAVAAETLRTLSGLVAGFLAGHPGVSFRLFQSPAPAMAAQLQAGEVDLCLASQPLPGPAFASVELLSEEVLLAVPPSHRLAGRTRATAAELAGEPFVTTRPGYWQRALTDRLFTDAVIVC